MNNNFTYNDLTNMNEEFIKKLPVKQFSTDLAEYFNDVEYSNDGMYAITYDFDSKIMNEIIVADYYKKDSNDRFDDYEGTEKITAKEWFKSSYWMFKIWLNYAKAMSRNKPDSVLYITNFFYYANQPNVYYFEYKGNFVIGQINKGLFTPTHFAPDSLRGGVELIKELKKYDNVVFAVTEDLSKMLIKAGFKTIPFSKHLVDFRGKDVMKTLLGSNLFKNVIVYLSNLKK